MASNQRKRATLFTPVGVSGLPRYSGYIFNEWLKELQGPRGRRVLREMQDNDPIIGGLLFAIEMLLRQVEWRIEDHPDASSTDERTDFLESCRTDMDLSWPDTLSEIMTFLGFGFAPCEINYKRRTKATSQYDDGRIGWQGWPLRSQESLLRWAFDEQGGVIAFHQLGPPDFVEHVIPIEKLLLFRTTARLGNPEGRSILRNAYRPWYALKHMQAIEGIGAERDVAGLPVFWVPPEIMQPGANGAESVALTEYKKMVTNIRQDEEAGLVMPAVFDEAGNKLYDFQLVSTAGQKQFDLDQIITRYEKRVAMTVLVDFIMLGQDNVGSQSLGETKSKLFDTALNAWLDMICDEANGTAIPRLLKLNGMSTELAPRLVHGRIDKPDISTISAFLAQIGQSKSGAGITLDTRVDGDLAKWLMEQLDAPPPPDADDLPDPIAPPPNAGQMPPNGTLPAPPDEEDDEEDDEDTPPAPAKPKQASEPDGKKDAAAAALLVHATRRTGMADMLHAHMTRHYQTAFDAAAKKHGAPSRPISSKARAALRKEADTNADSVADTYGEQVQNAQARGETQASVDAKRSTYKAEDVLGLAAGIARKAGMLDFYRSPDAPPSAKAQTFHVDPQDYVCEVCGGYVGMGSFNADTADSLPIPNHPNCVHEIVPD